MSAFTAGLLGLVVFFVLFKVFKVHIAASILAGFVAFFAPAVIEGIKVNSEKERIAATPTQEQKTTSEAQKTSEPTLTVDQMDAQDLVTLVAFHKAAMQHFAKYSPKSLAQLDLLTKSTQKKDVAKIYQYASSLENVAGDASIDAPALGNILNTSKTAALNADTAYMNIWQMAKNTGMYTKIWAESGMKDGDAFNRAIAANQEYVKATADFSNQIKIAYVQLGADPNKIDMNKGGLKN